MPTPTPAFAERSTVELHEMLSASRSLEKSQAIAAEIDRRECLNRGIKPVRVVTESLYQQRIRMRLAETGHVGKYDPRHIEAFMRLELGTLDWPDRQRFNAEIEIARQCVDLGGVTEAEACALSYGL